MGFVVAREIVAGNTLIAESVQSQNYQAGMTGWAIFADGSYEFGAGGTFRGNLSIVNPSGSRIDAFTNGTQTEIDLQPPNSATPGTTFGPARLVATSTNDQPLLVIKGPPPLTPIAGDAGQLNLGSDPVAGQTAGYLLAQQVVIGDTSAGSTTEVLSPIVQVDGVLQAANRITGNVNIVPVANTPTSVLVPFGKTLKGTTFTCQVSANSSVPGSTVQGVSYTALTSTSVTLWIYRTTAVSTSLSYTVEGF